MTTIITVKLRNGQSIQGRADFGKGSPANPMTYDEAAEKFLGCASFAKWNMTKAEAIIEQVRSLEHIENIKALMANLSE